MPRMMIMDAKSIAGEGYRAGMAGQPVHVTKRAGNPVDQVSAELAGAAAALVNFFLRDATIETAALRFEGRLKGFEPRSRAREQQRGVGRWVVTTGR